jgi:hypothetical protein
MNHKPRLEAYNSLLFDKANLKCMRVIIKYRHEVFTVSLLNPIFLNYLTIGACGAETSILFIFEFSGKAIRAL